MSNPQTLKIHPWTGIVIQKSFDEGKTWEDMPTTSHAPFSHEWLTVYVGGTYEVAWRNANRSAHLPTLYRLERFKH